MANKADLGSKYDFQISTAAGGATYQIVGELLDFSGPSLSREAVEATHQASTWEEFIQGFKSGGEVSGSIHLADESDNTGQEELFDAFEDESGTLYNFRVTNDGTTAVFGPFSGIITALEPSFPVKDRATLDFTVRVDGDPTVVFKN